MGVFLVSSGASSWLSCAGPWRSAVGVCGPGWSPAAPWRAPPLAADPGPRAVPATIPSITRLQSVVPRRPLFSGMALTPFFAPLGFSSGQSHSKKPFPTPCAPLPLPNGAERGPLPHPPAAICRSQSPHLTPHVTYFHIQPHPPELQSAKLCRSGNLSQTGLHSTTRPQLALLSHCDSLSTLSPPHLQSSPCEQRAGVPSPGLGTQTTPWSKASAQDTRAQRGRTTFATLASSVVSFGRHTSLH